MSKAVIPVQVKTQADEIVQNFNTSTFKDTERGYLTRYKGAYLYLDRYELGLIKPICRLKYSGDLNDWNFAIFKYSNQTYDQHEWFFPGSGYVDGTLEGAMKAGLQAYP